MRFDKGFSSAKRIIYRLQEDYTMKKLICAFLALAMLASLCVAGHAGNEEKSFGAYKRVFIIGVDGAGRFIRDADTPEFDRIFKDGAVDYTARAEVKTDSGPNWGAILTGVSIFKTGLQNGVTGEKERTSETEFPTIFTYMRKAKPDAVLASFVNWNNINYGIIENDINVNKVNVPDDEKLTDAICSYFDEGNAPELFFVQLDSVDHVGHEKGSRSDEYFRQISVADGYVGRIYDAIERNGLMEDGLFIVVADHGHMSAGGHGGLTMRESQVTVALAGKTVAKGGTLDSSARNRDVAAIALYALGIERPDDFTAVIPANTFTGVEGESRPSGKDFADTFVSALAWIITLITGIAG